MTWDKDEMARAVIGRFLKGQPSILVLDYPLWSLKI